MHALLNDHCALKHRGSLLRVWFLAEKGELQETIEFLLMIFQRGL